ncbi:MAG TPA: SGNH/GDSL hydrolase family protein, partial [Telluria sp.]|nr:SGNH/GDSL hydrolase family protein [Telluria sp.]
RRRALLLAGALLAAGLAAPPPALKAQDTTGARWVATWGAAPAGPPASSSTQTFSNQTLRLIAHTSIGGARVRIRLSNEMGSAPLRIGSAHIGLRASGASIVAGTDRTLTFGGKTSITIPPGAPALSDPVVLTVAPLSDVAVSLYLPGTVGAATVHGNAMQTSYVSTAGNYTASTTLPTQLTIATWPFLAEVDVESDSAAIVTLGDSITDGLRSTSNANRRWPDWLARRLNPASRLAVVNRGITGNRLLANAVSGSLAGRSALERFERDVLATTGIKYLVFLIGINDIGNSPDAAPVSADTLISGYQQLLARARIRGIKVIGATLTPFEGAGYDSPAKELVRLAINNWIRTGGELDGVIDFDQALRDPLHPSRLLPAYDSGDHIHPNDAGYQAMGNAVPLALFQ